RGLKGDPGEQGIQGVKGDKGDKGDTGPSGISKRIDTYVGSTNSSGDVTFTYTTAFPDQPIVSIEPLNSDQYFVKKMSASASGITLRVFQRQTITLLGAELLLGSVTAVNGAEVRIVVTAR